MLEGRPGEPGREGPSTGGLAETEITVETEEPITTTEELSDSVYAPYQPQKLKIPGAKPHPGYLAQSAAMSAVEPPAPTYTPNLPKEVITQGKLSIAQLEAVVYAGQAHQQVLPEGARRGFFIGDGTGVGKGREISGIIMDNMRQGRTKAVWISKNAPLFDDAKRDFGDIGGDPGLLFNLGSIKLGMPVKNNKGILFTTYDTLKEGLELTGTTGIATRAGKQARMDQIISWLGPDFDGVIVFDEAHNMGNAISLKGKRGKTKPALKALAGVELQRRLPKARIVYVSATGATEVFNLAYADRLGLWGTGTPFADKLDFISKIQAGGLAAMELVARDMKAMGVYLARNLDFNGVTYNTLTHELSPDQVEIYDEMARAWQIVLQNINKALEETGQARNGKAKGNAMAKFWGAQQRFFNQILTSMQMPSVIEKVREDLKQGNAVVMQLVNTNEATQNRQLARMEEGDNLEDLDLTPRDILMQYLEKSFPIQQYEEYTDEDGNVRTRLAVDSHGNPVINQEAVRMRDELLARLGSMKVPEGPLEFVLNTFGSENVAEVTGRRQRVVKVIDEATGRKKAVRETRSPRHVAADVQAFMDDKKRILIFSDAGGTGKSYHASLTAKNQRRRIHYLIQAGWRADNAVQGFGRTHRTNQASAPHYILVTTNLKGQKRFISSIARRLDQLGALTKGQRQTGSQGLFSAKDNLESNIARDALTKFYAILVEKPDMQIGNTTAKELLEQKMGLHLTDEYGNLLESEDLRDIPKFLNRILVLESDTQNEVFDMFYGILEMLVENAIANGTLD
ncbi:MAG: strawberry notch family protein, partial [Firmicutes bacterium]|nr:strawberry notch family protein [Bacillota bacterium]